MAHQGQASRRGIAAYDRAIARDPRTVQRTRPCPGTDARPLYTTDDGTASRSPRAAGSEQALPPDANNAEAYLVRAYVHSIRFEEVAARADFDRALSLAPGNVDVLNFAGDNLQSVVNLRRAERLKRQAMALDPLSFVLPMDLAFILRDQGRFREALAMNAAR